MSFIGQIKKLEVEIPLPPFSHFVFLSPLGLEKTKWAPNKRYMGYPGSKRNIGEAQRRWDAVPIKFLRPVGKRTMAEVEVVHVAATRLVC